MQLLSVNQAISVAAELHGKRVYIEGLLTYEYENISINHWPKVEQQTGYNCSSILLVVSCGGAFCFDSVALKRLANKRAVAFGELQKTNNAENFMPFWPVQLTATRLESLKQWQYQHP